MFECGFVGASGGALSGFQRMLGTDVQVQGKKGTGRAAVLRSYTVTVRRVEDGRTLAETIGPAYLLVEEEMGDRASNSTGTASAELGWKP